MDPILALAARHDAEIARLARLEEIDRLGRHLDRRRGGLGSVTVTARPVPLPALSLGGRDRPPDQHQPTDKARGRPGPDQAKVSPKHRALTFLDGAVPEGPILPYPLRPESPPTNLLEMIQFLRRCVASPAHFPTLGDAGERSNIQTRHLLIFGQETREHRSNCRLGTRADVVECTICRNPGPQKSWSGNPFFLEIVTAGTIPATPLFDPIVNKPAIPARWLDSHQSVSRHTPVAH